MKNLFRILILGGIFAGVIWFFLSPQPDHSDNKSRKIYSSPQKNEEQGEDGQPGWSQEERAIWRDNINRRLMR
ncbi:MAG: hypothetical protein ABW085_11900 [Sedimenticola sp.]